MNHAPWIAVGILVTVVLSMIGLVRLPQGQLKGLEPYKDLDRVAPVQPAGEVAEGRRVYIDLGCMYCHSQQVRPPRFGADLDRGWGMRRAVARDYIFHDPPLLGSMRTGPDLLNIGARQPSREWHHLHLYHPRITSPGSIMPPHPFLYELRTSAERLPIGAVALPKGWTATPAWLLARARAVQLVEYLKSLDHTYELPEAK